MKISKTVCGLIHQKKKQTDELLNLLKVIITEIFVFLDLPRTVVTFLEDFSFCVISEVYYVRTTGSEKKSCRYQNKKVFYSLRRKILASQCALALI